MARKLFGDVLTTLQTATGTEPVVVLDINFGAGVSRYSTRSFPGCRPIITSIGQYVCERREKGMGTAGSVSITLSDYDGWMKFVQDNTQIEKAPFALYLYFADRPLTQNICLLKGELAGPIDWNQADQTVTVTLTTLVETPEAGFAATDEFEDLAPEARNAAWPMLFGTPKHVPAVRVRRPREGRLLTPIRLNSALYRTEGKKVVMDENCHVISYLDADQQTDKMYIEGGSDFPQNTTVKVEIDQVVFEGKFDGEVFTVSHANAPYYTDVPIETAVARATDAMSQYVFKVGSTFKGNLTGFHVYIKGRPGQRVYNFVEIQEEDTGFFLWSWKEDEEGEPIVATRLTSGAKIERAYAILPNGISNDYTGVNERLLQLERYNVNRRKMEGGELDETDLNIYGITQLQADRADDSNGIFWNRPAGTIVRLMAADPEIYVISCIPITEVVDVYGKKDVEYADGTKFTAFEPIPESYYDVQLESNYTVGSGETKASALLFHQPMSSRKEEGWHDEVYVTAVSSVGPNVSDIIKYILETWVPNLDLDTGSFASAKTAVESHPANFAVLEVRNALELASDIAWQARCALRVDGIECDLIYLDESKTPTLNANESMVMQDSIVTGSTPVTDIKTKYIGQWQPDYRNFAEPSAGYTEDFKLARKVRNIIRDSGNNQLHSYVWRENIARYGVRSETSNFYIYDNEDSVAASVEYWGHLAANTWRTVTIQLSKLGVILQPFDWMTIAVDGWGLEGYNPMNGEVEDVRFDLSDRTVTVRIRLPVQAGD